MAKNPYKVLLRPNTRKADIIRATLPNVHDRHFAYATCITEEQAIELCRLLNLGLDVEMTGTVEKLGKKVMSKPKPRGRK